MKRQVNIWVIVPMIGLSLFGAFNLYGIRPDLLKNFLLFLLFGWISFFAVRFVSLDLIKQNSKAIYTVFLLLLLFTYFFSSDIRGSKRWIDLHFFQFQTSEFFKPFFLVIVAHLLSFKNKFQTHRLFILFVAALIPLFAIFVQPDLGMVLQFLVVLIVMLYFGGTSTRLIANILAMIALLLPFSWHFLHDYQKARIIGFMNPELDPQGLSYNLTQSIITVGSGGIFGRGLGLGTQARYRFLPEFQTDFAFASLVEQFGFIGSSFVILFYALLILQLIRRIFQLKGSQFKYLYLIGATTFLSMSVIVNIGMNLGMMPVTGIALPFISYGGSSVVSTLLLLGFAFSM